MVLLLPEMIAKNYFRALHDGTIDPVLRAVVEQIAQDEDGISHFTSIICAGICEDALQSPDAGSDPVAAAFSRNVLAVMLDHRAVLHAVDMTAAILERLRRDFR